MKTKIIFCMFLLSIMQINAKEHVFTTKLYGDFVFNDITNAVTFRGKTYKSKRIEETNSGINLYCLLADEQKRLFEIYGTEISAYLVEYQSQQEIDEARKIEAEKNKITLYREGVGRIDVEQIVSNIARNRDAYWAGLEDVDFQKTMDQISKIIQFMREGKSKVDLSGRFTIPSGGEGLSSDGQYHKNSRGKFIKDNNYYNNLAYFILGKAINDASAIATPGKSYAEQASDDKYARGENVDVQWVQMLKTEIIIEKQESQNPATTHSNTPAQNSPKANTQPQRKVTAPQNTLRKDPNFKTK